MSLHGQTQGTPFEQISAMMAQAEANKSREIVAVNKKAADFGLKPGMKCSSVGSPEQHKGCLCNRAADNKETVAVSYEGPFGKAFGYWIPIEDRPEWIIHFGVGSTFEYEASSIKR